MKYLRAIIYWIYPQLGAIDALKAKIKAQESLIQLLRAQKQSIQNENDKLWKLQRDSDQQGDTMLELKDEPLLKDMTEGATVAFKPSTASDCYAPSGATKYENCFNAYRDIEDKIIDCAVYDIFKAGYDAGFRQFSARVRGIDSTVDGTEETRLMFVDDGNFLGTVGLQYRKLRAANIRQLYVKEDCRGRGIGSYLVEECCRIAKESGCETLGLVVDKANDGAREFYAKLGFIFAYQYNNGDDLMTKVLGA